MRNVYVQDIATPFPVSRALSQAEVKRQLAQLLGATWISTAEVCDRNGDFYINRVAAAPKGL